MSIDKGPSTEPPVYFMQEKYKDLCNKVCNILPICFREHDRVAGGFEFSHAHTCLTKCA